MLKISDVNKNLIGAITAYEDLCIESVLSTGDSTLSFYYHINNIYAQDLQEEGYITTKNNEYVIKEINSNSSKLEVKASLNVEDLEGKTWEHFNTTNENIEDCINLALAGTGWTIASCNITKKRTIKLTNCNSWQILKEAKKVYRAEFKFDAINKKLHIYENRGEDKGVYFIESLNLEAIDIQSNTYDFYTRIIPKGKDDLGIENINNGKNYLENHQYSNKIKTLIWSDDRYTIAKNLKEDAEYKLNELSKPYRAYATIIKDLAKLNNKYKNILSFKLGDTITLVSKTRKIKEKQRIVKIIEYPQNPLQNSCELANKTLTFEELQQDLIEVADTVDNITTDNGTINGSSIDSIKTSQIKDFNASVAKITNLEVVNATIENLQANKADINSLNAVTARIGTLEATKANITDLQAINANISNLQASKADITTLEAATAKIEVLEANTGKVQDLINGNLSSQNIQASGITGDRLNMKTVFIDDANIVNVNASKMNAGELNTNKVKIKSEDGGIEIVGATQQWKDKNNKVRMQAGKDEQGDFNFIIRGEDGTSVLIDHTGVKEKAIADNLIRDTMIAPDAVGEKQINYNSFITGFNKDSNTTQIKATKVKLDNQNQTLDVAFTNLKNQADKTKTQTERNTTSINVQQGQINTAIANTKITKNGKEILLKDDYNTTVQSVNSIKNTISEHSTIIETQTEKIIEMTSKTNVLERDLESMSSSITEVEQVANTASSKASKVEQTVNSMSSKLSEVEKTASSTSSKVSSIEQNINSINQKVSAVENTTTSLNSKFKNHEDRITTAEEKITPNAIINTVSATVNQAKNDAISVSSKEISKVEQKVNEVTFSFQDISNENLLDNSSFEKEETYTKNHPFILDRLNGGVDGYPSSIDGGKYLRIYTNGSDSYFVKNTSIKIKPNTAYTISFYYCCTQSVNGSNYVFINGNPVNIPTRYIGDRAWHRISYTFRTNANIDGITAVRFGLVAQGTAWLLLDNIQIEEGEFLTKWKAKKDELCTGISFIDAGGIGVRHEDGSFTKMTANGFKRYIASSGYDYHYLTYTGKTQKLNINPVTIQLPNDFKGKDFKVSLSLEEIANPAGWFVQSVQLLVGNINKANGTFQILGGSQSQFHDGTQGTMKPTTISYTVTA